ncbi:hypothetical protein [Absidia glauca]|uniref:TATA element modulatory factor 1 TATA binding domain-containing protein n=1 Tax=Absidia glauca TaxID=4829 RepID=A0A163J5D8_ABSGL|nr:hypothetical protein [Absidia glauca]
MSFFSGNNQWGGLLKQAISNVETTFDTLLEQPETSRNNAQDEETETYMDPISGMVTTVPKKKKKVQDSTTTTESSTTGSRPSTPKATPASPASPASPLQRQQSDLSARLAAVMNEKKARSSTSSRPTSIHSNSSIEPPLATPQQSSVTGPENSEKAKHHSTDASATKVEDTNSEVKAAPLDSKNDKDNDDPDDSTKSNGIMDAGKDTNIDKDGIADSSSSPLDQNDLKLDPDTNVLDTSPILDAAEDNKDDKSLDSAKDLSNSKESAVATTAHDPPLIERQEPATDTSVSKDGDDESINDDSVSTTDPITATSATGSDGGGDNNDDDDVNDNVTALNSTDITSVDSSNTITEGTSTTAAPASVSDIPDDHDGKSTTISTPSSSDDKDRILAQREQQLFQAMETIAKLHDQIHGLQQDGDTATSQIKSLQNRLQEVSTSQISSRNGKKLEQTIQDLNKQLVSKEEQIQGLLKEGEKLSKNELKQANTIKRLRVEKQEQDKSLADTQKRLDKSNADLNDLTAKSKRSGESEKRAQESVKMLTEMTERQTKHINKLETDLIHLKEQYQQSQAELTSTLENLDKERDKAKVESEQVHAAALEKEVAANGRLHKELTTTKETAQALESKLRTEIRDLQIALQALETQAGQREDNLRREVADIQNQLQRRDAHLDEVAGNVEEATTPLLRQIEELQTQHSLAIKNRDQAEQRMNEQLHQVEAKYKRASSELTAVQTELQGLRVDLADKQQHLEEVLKEKHLLSTQLEDLSNTAKALQDKLDKQQLELDEQNAQSSKITEDIKKQYQKLMRERLQEEKKQWDAKHQQQYHHRQQTHQPKLQQQYQEQQQIADSKQSTLPPNSPPSFAAEDSSPSSSSSGKGDDHSPIIKRPEIRSPSTSTRSSVDSGYTNTFNHSSQVPPTIAIDRLQTTIRQMENQLDFYQTQLQSATQSRDEISEELMAMALEMDKLRDDCKKMQALESENADINRRYQASLELLGERTEQVEELRADIADVKDMYRTQIVEMVQKIDQLSSQKST